MMTRRKVMKKLLFCAFVTACSASPVSADPLQLSIQNGIVTLDAQEVTVRQILAEWARVGKTRIVNGERLSGGPITLKLAGVPEKQALEIVLRTVPGYMAMPRDTFVADASRYDRILIMPTTSAVAAVRPTQPSPGMGGFSGVQGGANVTQLRPPQPQQPVIPQMPQMPEMPDPTADQIDDAAIAAAAAAGLITVPGLMPGAAGMPPQFVPPPGVINPPATATAPAVTAPTNPWNATAGTSQPSLAPPPPPPGSQPPVRQRPAQADR